MYIFLHTNVADWTFLRTFATQIHSKDMKIGDKVRFLSETGEGRVAGFKGKDLVLVEDEDGFQIPVKANEVVVIGEEDYEKRTPAPLQGTGRKPLQAKEEHGPSANTTSVKAAQHGNTAQKKFSAPAFERKGGERLSAYLAFVPIDPHQLTTTRFEAYFINDSNYYMRVCIHSVEGSSYRLRQTMEVEPNMQVFLEEFGREDLPQIERLGIQLLAYKREKPFLPKPAVATELRIDGVKFYKLHTFQASEFFEQPALVYTIVEDDRQPRPLVVDAQELKNMMYATPSADFDRKGGDGKNELLHTARGTEATGGLVVDLHADQLLDTTAGMQPTDILDYQLDVFRRTLQNYARKRGTRIIFIHGKGDGVLRQAIISELRYKYKQYTYQDASFREYGYGATQVTIK